MKKHSILFLLLLLCCFSGFTQTTATDFTANDCNGVSHHLFGELDAGKVIVVSFVEPCSGCVAPSNIALTAVQNYRALHPGAQVLFYVASDFGTYSCSGFSGLPYWTSSNGLHATDAVFSDPAFVTTQYGPTPYMPKIVVLGGTSHHVFLNAEGATLDTTIIQDSIYAAFNPTGFQQVNATSSMMHVFPNPAKDNISFSYFLKQTSTVSIEVFNLIGTKIYSTTKEKQAAGVHELPIAIGNNVSNGIYFIKLTIGQTTEVYKFIIEK